MYQEHMPVNINSGAEVAPAVRRNRVKASIVLAWMDVSVTMRSLRHAGKGVNAWSRLFAHSGQFDQQPLRRDLHVLKYDTLRTARVRAD